MSHNRMYLINRRLDKKILLAKFYPCNWFVHHDDLVEKLNILFGEDIDCSNFGPIDWEIEYEYNQEDIDEYNKRFKEN